MCILESVFFLFFYIKYRLLHLLFNLLTSLLGMIIQPEQLHVNTCISPTDIDTKLWLRRSNGLTSGTLDA